MAKEVRTQTGIGHGATSVGSVAVELAEKIFAGDLSDKTVMILGRARWARPVCAIWPRAEPVRCSWPTARWNALNRWPRNSAGAPCRFDERLAAMIEADIVVSSTGSPTTVLHRHEIAGILAARSNRPLVLMDIAVPRDIATDVEELDNVYLYNIDHLEAVVRENSRMREQELSKCNEIIARRTTALMLKLNPPPIVRPVADVELVPGWTLCEAAT